MNDQFSLMADGENVVTLFSFATGAELAHGNAPLEFINKLNAAPMAAFTRHGSTSGPAFEETCVFKSERFDASGRFAAGIRCQATGDISGAIGHYRAVIEAEPSMARALNLAGLCLRVSGDVAGAEDCYKKSISAASHLPEAYCNLGILFQKAGRDEEAQQLFLAALARDQFYFNALLRRAEWLLEAGQINNPEFSELNLRLLMHFSEIGAVQRHLFKAAERSDMAIEDFSEKLHNDNGAMASSKIQKLQKLIESQILNGAMGAAAGNMNLLSSLTPQTQAEKAVFAWCRQRAGRIGERLGNHASQFDFFKTLQPFMISEDSEKTAGQKKAPLGVAEFFSLVLLEVMRDGQIEPAEHDLLQRLRTALNVPEDAYITMFNNVRRQLAGIEVSGGLREKFSHQRLFKNLCQAAFRDGVVEDSEKKILGFACKAFNVSPEEFKRIIAEVPR
ncbi:MAG: tetratricopeptide repeat protein [Candidatus Riflebacteria bacterium]|nr:tetratricopeptide repeat protein [Candidatus Riflebacteria bacterium]